MRSMNSTQSLYNHWQVCVNACLATTRCQSSSRISSHTTDILHTTSSHPAPRCIPIQSNACRSVNQPTTHSRARLLPHSQGSCTSAHTLWQLIGVTPTQEQMPTSSTTIEVTKILPSAEQRHQGTQGAELTPELGETSCLAHWG